MDINDEIKLYKWAQDIADQTSRNYFKIFVF